MFPDDIFLINSKYQLFYFLVQLEGLSKQAAKEFAKCQICLFIFYLQESISILAKILLYHQVSFRFYRILIEFWTYLLTS